MIYIIAGCPLSGKTTLARELSNLTKIPYISTDDLSILFTYYTKYSLFEGSNYYKYYETSSLETIRRDHLFYQQKMGEMLIHFLKTKLLQEESLIIEGFVFSSAVLDHLPSEQTRAICLIMDEQLLRTRYNNTTCFSRKKEDRILFDQKYIDKLLWLNNSNKTMCQSQNIPIIIVNNNASMLSAACKLLNISEFNATQE